MNIAILYTGGTIGSAGTPLAPLAEDQFELAFRDIVTPIVQSQFPTCSLAFIPFGVVLDSTNIQPADWVQMAQVILDNYTRYDGFVVLHGTDTMAFTAAALSFMLTGLQADGFPNAVLSKTVVLTGSQLPLFHINEDEAFNLLFNTDALQNVCGAIAAAQLSIPEVCLYFNDTLFRGNRTVKTNADEFHAFSSPNYPALGENGIEFYLENNHILHLPTTQEISLDHVRARQQLHKQLDHVAHRIDDVSVIPFLAFPGHFSAANKTSMLGDMLAGIIDHVDLDGVVLESYGEGNFPSGNPDEPAQGAIYSVLKRASEKGIIIVDCTQVLDGVVQAAVYAAGSWLKDVGVAVSYDMTSNTALTKLIYLVSLRDFDGYDWDASTIKRLMQTNLTGEMMDVNRLDARGKWYLGAGESIESFDGSVTLLNDPVQGPILQTAKGEIIWRALSSPSRYYMPGRLYMQGDGNLIFYDNSNAAVWSSGTKTEGPATSMLILENTEAKGIRLFVYNYALGEVSAMLYDESTI